MKPVLPLLALFAFTAAVPAPAPPPSPLDYRFDDVRRTVTLSTQNQQGPAAKGQRAQSGDKVHTGWFSYALIASEKHRARFEIFSSSDVELAGNEPGVILSLERGRLHAMFDKITGTEPRVVKTPGALLAVRGTQYLAEVDAKGETVVDVYEGIVEIRSPLTLQPMLIHAGESSTFSRRRPPEMAPTPRDRQRPDGQNPRDREGKKDEADRNQQGRGQNRPGEPGNDQPPNGGLDGPNHGGEGDHRGPGGPGTGPGSSGPGSTPPGPPPPRPRP
ncbi:MAG: hypothetical protein JWO56_10 [Acidobacteria bacterium]|nr:hypothetical protein [Acidobacteriota bacterium]